MPNKPVEEPDITPQDESTIDSIWDEIVKCGGIDEWMKDKKDD